jgi:hypothetical protein
MGHLVRFFLEVARTPFVGKNWLGDEKSKGLPLSFIHCYRRLRRNFKNCHSGRDPESRKLFENQTILDLPPTRGRETTNYNTACKKDGAIWHIVVMTTGIGTGEK